MKKFFLLIGLTFTLFITGCTSTSTSNGSIAGNSIPSKISGKTYGLIFPYNDTKASISFFEDGVLGNGGINRFFSKVDISGTSITFGPIGSTKMAGSPENMKKEDYVFGVLEKANYISISGDYITIISSDNHSLKYKLINPQPIPNS